MVCIDENLVCYIKVDDKINPELKLENLFQTKPDIYEYTKDQELLSFNSISSFRCLTALSLGASGNIATLFSVSETPLISTHIFLPSFSKR